MYSPSKGFVTSTEETEPRSECGVKTMDTTYVDGRNAASPGETGTGNILFLLARTYPSIGTLPE